MRTLFVTIIVLMLVIASAPASAQDPVVNVVNDKVGIGTETPDSTLHVFDIGAHLHVEDSSTTAQYGAGRTLFELESKGKVVFRFTNNDSVGNSWKFENDVSGFFFSRDGSGATEMAVLNNGDLRIAGSLKAQGYTGSCPNANCFPDFVFADDYELMPLEDLHAFVRTNRHLPNVPSAEDVRSSGALDMTQMQLRLLEKVEELTLYTLQQEKTIRQQQETIGTLEARLAALESR